MYIRLSNAVAAFKEKRFEEVLASGACECPVLTVRLQDCSELSFSAPDNRRSFEHSPLPAEDRPHWTYSAHLDYTRWRSPTLLHCSLDPRIICDLN